MTRNRLIILAVVALAVAAGVWLLFGGASAGPGASPSASIGPVPESDTVAADVRAVPIRHAELAAPSGGGVVAEVLVAEGDQVTAGQALLRLDGTRLEAAVAQAAATVAAAEAQQEQARAAARQAAAQVTVADAGVDQAAAAVRTADATRDGTPSGAARRAAAAEVDRARAALRSARAQLTAARRASDAADAAVTVSAAEIERAKAALTDAQVAVGDLTLEAPFAGLVASLDAVVGETVSPGTPIVRLADTSGWRFETIDLDEAAVGRLAEGAEATVTVDAFPDIEIPAQVASISPFGESSAGDIIYVVTLEPSGDLPDGLRWNMTASAEIRAGQ
jgi:multidrug resistance efflux pump